MAPKKAAKNAKKEKTEKEGDTAPLILDRNAPYVQENHGVVAAITGNVKAFKGIESAKPLTVEEGGIQAPFDSKSFRSAMTKGTECICE